MRFYHFFALTVFLLLGACRTVMDPTFMPAGYTYHQNNYKSPVGPDAWGIGYDYTAAANADIMRQWQNVAADLIDQMQSNGADTSQAAGVYLAPPKLDNAFTHSLDHALRSELQTRGYTLVNIPDDGSTLINVDTYDPEFKDKMRGFVYNDNTKQEEFKHQRPPQCINKDLVVTFAATRAGAEITRFEKPYNLPLFGYEDPQLYFPMAQSVFEVRR